MLFLNYYYTLLYEYCKRYYIDRPNGNNEDFRPGKAAVTGYSYSLIAYKQITNPLYKTQVLGCSLVCFVKKKDH